MVKKILLLEKFNMNSRLNELDYYFKNMTINQKGKRIEFVDSKKEIIFYYYVLVFFSIYITVPTVIFESDMLLNIILYQI